MNLKKGLDRKPDFRGRNETIKTTGVLKSACILIRIIEIFRYSMSLKFGEKSPRSK